MNSDEIEQMNAHGPYDHGVWRALDPEGLSVEFGSSSLFATRAEVISAKIADFLARTYSAEELASFTILDVGCYDGWVLASICDRIRFAKAVGVEPRQKNIDKGVFARRICGIETACEFLQGGYEDLDRLFPDTTVDIVLCLGMLHHVASAERVIRICTAKSARLFIVDSMVIPPLEHDLDRIAPVINPVDIVYRNKERRWGIAAYKMESPYFDGSTSDAELVNIPQEALIRMCLDSARFEDVQALMTEKDFYPADYQAIRGVNEVMLAAFRGPDAGSAEPRWMADARGYEALFTVHPPREVFIRYLRAVFGTRELEPSFAQVLGEAVTGEIALSNSNLDADEREIASAVPRSPYEKILLELGKYQLQHRNTASARSLLSLVTTRRNADWRSFYRACFLLARLERNAGNAARAGHYERLLALSNPLFPAGDLEGQCAF